MSKPKRIRWQITPGGHVDYYDADEMDVYMDEFEAKIDLWTEGIERDGTLLTELRSRIDELEGALHELRAEGQQMHDDNLTLREQRRKSRGLLERAQHVLREAKRRWAKYMTNSDADVLMADIERHLSGEGE